MLGWDSFFGIGVPDWPSIADLPYRAATSSGRAALYAALRQIDLAAGARVLVPTYHCPTMVAPIVEAGLVPTFYPLGADGLPALDRIDPTPRAGAMFASHYFGLAHGLRETRDWCDRHGIVLVEDCAHSYFGSAGDRPVGCWGDYAIASVSKFFPVPEGGLLASATRPLRPFNLRAPTWRAQARALWQVVDRARDHGRLSGLTHTMLPIYWLRGRKVDARAVEDEATPSAEAIIAGCDMSRVGEAPSWVARALHACLPRGRIVQRRRQNYIALAGALAGASGAHALVGDLPAHSAPYVLPLWVDGAARADAVYARLRAERVPVFRWDRLWPGTPTLAGDTGALWSRQVMQLLCHQDLSHEDIDRVAALVREALRAARGS